MLAELLGLSREAAYDVIDAVPLGAQGERRRGAIESGEYPARFRLALARKDADLVAEAASAAGADLRLAEAERSWLRDAEASGLAEADYSAVLVRILEPDVSGAAPRQAVSKGTFFNEWIRDSFRVEGPA